jgi:hypothetical protein
VVWSLLLKTGSEGPSFISYKVWRFLTVRLWSMTLASKRHTQCISAPPPKIVGYHFAYAKRFWCSFLVETVFILMRRKCGISQERATSDHFVVCALMRDFIAGCFWATGVTSRISIEVILEGGVTNMPKMTLARLRGL